MPEAISQRYDAGNRNEGVPVVYTGGTIGSMPSNPADPRSPLAVVDWAAGDGNRFPSHDPAAEWLTGW